MTRVVNIRHEECDVYIGRPSKWGNPFTHIVEENTLAKYVVRTRVEAVEKYEEYLRQNEELMRQLPELKGKKLGCWCHPKQCHGHVLLKLLKEMDEQLW